MTTSPVIETGLISIKNSWNSIQQDLYCFTVRGWCPSNYVLDPQMTIRIFQHLLLQEGLCNSVKILHLHLLMGSKVLPLMTIGQLEHEPCFEPLLLDVRRCHLVPPFSYAKRVLSLYYPIRFHVPLLNA